MDALIAKIVEARRLGLTGHDALVFVGVKVAGIGEEIVFVSRR